MADATIPTKLTRLLSGRQEIAFAYLHGSSVNEEEHRDIDIALYLYPERFLNNTEEYSFLEYSIPLEQELEKSTGKPFDIQILNTAPLPFRSRVVTGGIVILDNDPAMREQFELLSRVEYFDFRPRRERYLREAFS